MLYFCKLYAWANYFMASPALRFAFNARRRVM